MPAESVSDQLSPVDGAVQDAADLGAAQRGRVHVQNDRIGIRPLKLENLDAGRGRERVPCFDADVVKHVDLPAKHVGPGGANRRIALEHDAIDGGLARVVALMGEHLDLVCIEWPRGMERPASDRRLAALGNRQIEAFDEKRRALFQRELELVVGDDLNGLDVAECLSHISGQFAGENVAHDRRGDRLAVVKLSAANLQANRSAVGRRRPLFSNPAVRAAVGVESDQTFERDVANGRGNAGARAPAGRQSETDRERCQENDRSEPGTA